MRWLEGLLLPVVIDRGLFLGDLVGGALGLGLDNDVLGVLVGGGEQRRCLQVTLRIFGYKLGYEFSEVHVAESLALVLLLLLLELHLLLQLLVQVQQRRVVQVL